MKSGKTVASVSFLSDRTISMDVEQVTAIEIGEPMEVEPGSWFAELIIRSGNGTLSVQMLADDPAHFKILSPNENPDDEF
ncbi:MAG TPA: hypothetical protein VM661_08705 [Candidatus Sulfotelmatobacter sp.]|jgi:hypothetical protein|nr:hypothetical protein [Candidatus Sulfotelmatobacter sp.]